MKLISLIVLLTSLPILSSCDQTHSQKPTRYMMNLHVMQSSNDISKAKELKAQRFVICFTDISGKPLCSNKVASGDFIDLRSISPFVKLVSIKLLGDSDYTYAFPKGSEPTVTLNEPVTNAYMGSLLIFVEKAPKSTPPEVSLFCACREKIKNEAVVSLIKLGRLTPDDTVSIKCMEIGSVIDSYMSPHGHMVYTPDDTASLLQVIPHVQTSNGK